MGVGSSMNNPEPDPNYKPHDSLPQGYLTARKEAGITSGINDGEEEDKGKDKDISTESHMSSQHMLSLVVKSEAFKEYVMKDVATAPSESAPAPASSESAPATAPPAATETEPTAATATEPTAATATEPPAVTATAPTAATETEPTAVTETVPAAPAVSNKKGGSSDIEPTKESLTALKLINQSDDIISDPETVDQFTDLHDILPTLFNGIELKTDVGSETSDSYANFKKVAETILHAAKAAISAAAAPVAAKPEEAKPEEAKPVEAAPVEAPKTVEGAKPVEAAKTVEAAAPVEAAKTVEAPKPEEAPVASNPEAAPVPVKTTVTVGGGSKKIRRRKKTIKKKCSACTCTGHGTGKSKNSGKRPRRP